MTATSLRLVRLVEELSGFGVERWRVWIAVVVVQRGEVPDGGEEEEEEEVVEEKATARGGGREER